MNIFFKRFMDSNVMVIADNNIMANDYRINMILKNRIENLLKLSIHCIDGNVELFYDISGKQSIEQYCLKEKLSYKKIKIIFEGLIHLYKDVQRYLLDINHLVMETNYIFINNNADKIYFCYYINQDMEFYDSFKRFVQKIVTVTNHSDRQAVELIYGILELCEADNFSFGEIVNYVSYVTDKEENEISDKTIEHELYTSKDILPQYNGNNCGINKKNRRESVFETLSGLFNKPKDNSNHLYDNDNEFSYVAESGAEIKDNENNGLLCDYDKHNIDMEDVEEINGETGYIGDKQNFNDKALYSVLTNDKIIISHYPFVIGKHIGKADGIIKDSSVSRLHAKIEMINMNYYVIEDLNSKNGTFVNGERLNPYEKVVIDIGDRIMFSTFEYIFK